MTATYKHLSGGRVSRACGSEELRAGLRLYYPPQVSLTPVRHALINISRPWGR